MSVSPSLVSSKKPVINSYDFKVKRPVWGCDYCGLKRSVRDRYNHAGGITTLSELISVTEAAASKIGTLLVEEKKDEAGLRVFVQGGGCSGFQYGLMLEDGAGDAEVDRVFQSNGVTLFVDPISIRYLNGAEVDFVDNLMGGGFTIKNPNAKSTCGCGQSFGV